MTGCDAPTPPVSDDDMIPSVRGETPDAIDEPEHPEPQRLRLEGRERGQEGGKGGGATARGPGAGVWRWGEGGAAEEGGTSFVCGPPIASLCTLLPTTRPAAVWLRLRDRLRY